MKKLIFILLFSALFLGANAQVLQPIYWNLTGNSGISPRNFLGTLDLNPLIFKTNGTERMRLLEDKGFLGIGTVNPQAPFHLHLETDYPNTEGRFDLLRITTSDLITDHLRRFCIYTQMPGDDIHIQVDNSANIFLEGPQGGLIIKPNGNVCIGTRHEICDEKLCVLGDASVAGYLKADELQASNAIIDGTVFVNDLQATNATIAGNLSTKTLSMEKLNVDTVNTKILSAQNANISNNAVVNGSLGMGTNQPKEKLQVLNGSILISKTTTSGTTGSLIFDDCSINDMYCGGTYHIWGIQYHHSSGKNGLEFWNNAAGIQTKTGEEDEEPSRSITSALFLANNNNVGIGTIIPQAMLDVAGSLQAENAHIVGHLTANTMSMEELTADIITTDLLNATSADISGTLSANVLEVESATIPTITGNTTITGNIATQGSFVLNGGTNASLALGKAYGKNLGWGTSYIGFNAVRNNTTGNWTCSGDNANNGGSVIYGTVGGDILFATIPTTNGNSQTLTDTQIKQNIKLQLTANGKLKAKEVEVTLDYWPDYVFDDEYTLMNLQETEQFIKENKHLPNVPTAAEVEANGVNLGEMNAILIQKIEELTLHILDLQKQINELKPTKKD